MKVRRRIFSLVLALVMVFSTCITSFADLAQEKGSITVQNTTVGETYEIYKIFDLTYAEPTVYTTPSTPNKGEVTSPVNYTFTGTATQAALLNGDDSPFVATLTSTADVYNITLKDDYKNADGTAKDTAAPAIIAFLEKDDNYKTLGGDAKASFSGTGKEVKTDDLFCGYYYITSSLGSVVTIDSNIKNVTVVDKNQKTPSWDNDIDNPDDPNPDNPGDGKVIILPDGKRATSSTANYDETVNFSIAVNAKATVKDASKTDCDPGLATYYYIKDKLGDGFTPAENIVVKVYKVKEGSNPAAYDVDNPVTLIKDTAYTIVQNTTTNEFAIQIPFGMKYGSEAKIEVTYSATVKNTDEVVLGATGNPNTASFTYDVEPYDPNPDSPEHYDPDPDGEDPDYPDPEHPFGGDPENPHEPTPDDVPDGTDPKTTLTKVYAIDVFKYTGASVAEGTPLKDAEFTFAKAQATLVDDKYVITDGTLTTVPLGADIDLTGTASYDYKLGGTLGSNKDNPLVTQADGKILIKGLQELPEGWFYVLTETKAPAGYNLLTEPIVIDLGDETSTTKIGQTTDEKIDNYAYHEDVENKSGVELPSTGGNGIGMFYLFGAILLAGGAVLLNTKRRIGANR